jgi:cell division protein FtsZ
LFGYGEAEGEGRAGRALELALESPMVDRGERLREARQVLVHICGGKSLTLFEIEGLMKDLGRHVGEGTQIRFGAAVDEGYGEAVSVTVISLAGTEEVVKEPVKEVVREEEKVAVAAIEEKVGERVEEVELPLPLAEEETVKGVDPHAMVPMPDSGTITMSSPSVMLGVSQPVAASVPVVVEEEEEGEVVEEPEPVEEVVEEIEEVVEEEEEEEVVAEEEAEVRVEELPEVIEEKPRKIDLREILRRQGGQAGGGERQAARGGAEDDDEPVISLRVPEPARVTPIRPIPAGTPVVRKEVPVERVEPESGRGVKGQAGERTAAEQAQQNFDDHLTPGADTRGRFDKGEPTVEEGENLDIPTFLRKKHR